MKNHFYRYSFLLLCSLPLLSSCTSDAPEFEPASADLPQSREIGLEILASSSTSTRCFDNTFCDIRNRDDGVTFLNLDGDLCKKDFSKISLDFIILIDGKFADRQKLLSGGKLNSVASSPYISYVELRENSVYMLMKFPGAPDPSKIEFLMSASLTGEEYDDYRSQNTFGRSPEFYNTYTGFFEYCFDPRYPLEDTFIYGRNTDRDCTYFTRHRLASANDWSQLETQIVLHRLNTEIIVLTEQEDYGAANYTQAIYAFPDYESGMPHTIFDTLDPNIGSYYLVNSSSRVSSNMSYFYMFDNRVSIMADAITVNNVPFKSCSDEASGRWTWNQCYKAVYKGKTYWAFPPVTFLALQDPFYPVDQETGRTYKYIQLIASEGSNSENMGKFEYKSAYDPKGHYDGDIHLHWTTLPFPEGGVQANKRYVYILGKDFPLWSSKIDKHSPQNGTRSLPGNEIPAGSFEILEMDIER